MLERTVAQAVTLSVVSPLIVSYLIGHAERGIFDPINPQLADLVGDRPVLIIVDETISRMYGNSIRQYTRKHLDCRDVINLTGNESTKTLACASELCERAIAARIPRDGVFIAIGGGTIMDVAGFAASIFRRGIGYVRIPTTLIGMIDVAVGIKQGVNVGHLKNVIGTFYPPLGAFNDRRFLATLPRRHLACGIAEALKIALVCDAVLYELLEAHARILIESGFQEPTDIAHEVLRRSEQTMIDQLSPNLYERDRRRLVDFGHSFSAMIETASNYTVPHGEAVALDMLLSIAVGIRAGIVPQFLLERLARLYQTVGLPLIDPLMTAGLMYRALEDIRLHRDGDLNLVVPTAIGTGGFLQDVSIGHLAVALEDIQRLHDDLSQ
jgi:2-epi-5-epi-valiolone synthase